MKERAKHQSTDPTLWLQVFLRHDVQGNKAGGLILHQGHSQTIAPFKQAVGRALAEDLVEVLGGEVTWGPRLEGQA